MDKYTKVLVTIAYIIDFFKAMSTTFYESSTYNFYLQSFKYSLFTKSLHNIIES